MDLYCENCKEETRHFATASLGLPACSQCMSLNSQAIFGESLYPSIETTGTVISNAQIESRVMHGGKK